MSTPHYTKRFVLLLILFVMMLSMSVSSVRADGSFNVLSFPDATPESCGTGWKVEGAYVAGFGEAIPWSVTDGRGAEIMSGIYTASHNNGGTVTSIWIRRSEVWRPRKNPIRVVMKSNGKVIADIKADIPCLPATPPPPVKFDPSTMTIPQEPTDRLVVVCRRNLFVVSGINDKSRKYSLTTFDLNKVIAAGGAGLTKDLRREGKLTLISAGGGNFALQWTGGRWNADGQVGSGFAKNFTCTYK
jgi:hypothetical protein